MESTIFTAIDYASQINDLLFSLKADTTYHAYSGLTAKNVEGSEAVVKIYDDYDSAEYYADQVIDALKGCDEIDWNVQDNTEYAFNSIWDAISGCLI
jgi:hypothetical protein